MDSKKIWLITGASQGLGLVTVRHLLAKQQTVIATTRNIAGFDPLLLQHPHLKVIQLDLTSETQVHTAIEEIIQQYGRIDVLINNAGHGFTGAVEEATEAEVAQVMEINVMTMLRMLRHVLPHMRATKQGHIINLSSMAGLSSTPGWGIYNASKYAVEGFSEALYYELLPLGIHVTILEPGAFRTNFLDDSLAVARQVIADYQSTAGQMSITLQHNNGRQPGNPEKAAAVIYELGHDINPPLRLLLGQDAFNRATKKLALLQEGFETTKTITLSTDYGK